jgi:hypothetical protein
MQQRLSKSLNEKSKDMFHYIDPIRLSLVKFVIVELVE